MASKARQLREAQEAVDVWNASYAVGSKVVWVTSLGREYSPRHTMGPAKVVCGQAVVCLMENISPIPLSELMPWVNTKP